MNKQDIEIALEDLDILVEIARNNMTIGGWLGITESALLIKDLLGKHLPLKLEYKNGFANCKCGCEFESEGYQGEEFCPDCGQKVWIGGYNGEICNVVNFR